MPWGAISAIGSAVLPAVGSALAGQAVNSLFGGGSSGGGGGGTSGSSAPPVYIPQDQQGADSNFLANKDAYQNTVNGQQQTVSPYNQQLLQGQMNNPYNQVSQQSAQYAQDQYYVNSNAAQTGATQGWANANQAAQSAQQQQQAFQSNLGNVQNSANTLYGMGAQSNANYQNLMNYQAGQLGNIENSQNGLYSSGNQVLNTAFDPQNALYNQQQQLNTDQSRASEYARGIQSSPYGAALENQSNQNFNLNWQNQQLARQTQGLSAAQGAYNSAQGMGNSYTSNQAGLQAGQNEQYAGLTNAATSQYANYLGAMNQSNAVNAQTLAGAQQNAASLGNYSAQQVTAGGQAQNNAYQNMYNQQNQALQNYTGNNQSYLSGLNQLQSNDLGYMNFGQGAQNVGYNQNMQNNQQQQQAISSIAGPIGSALQNTNWSNVGNTVSNWFSGSDANASLASGGWF